MRLDFFQWHQLFIGGHKDEIQNQKPKWVINVPELEKGGRITEIDASDHRPKGPSNRAGNEPGR